MYLIFLTMLPSSNGLPYTSVTSFFWARICIHLLISVINHHISGKYAMTFITSFKRKVQDGQFNESEDDENNEDEDERK